MLDKPAAIKKPFIDKELTDQLVVGLYNYFGVLIFLLVVAIGAGAWYYLLEPKFQAINSGAEFINKTKELESQTEYYKSLNAIKASYAKITAADKAKIDAFVNVSSDSNDLWKEIRYLARANHMWPDKIDPKELDASTEIANLANSSKRNTLMGQTKVWRTTLTLISDPSKGMEVTYVNLKKLLAAMETNLRLMDVQRIAFDPLHKTATVELLTYTRK